MDGIGLLAGCRHHKQPTRLSLYRKRPQLDLNKPKAFRGCWGSPANQEKRNTFGPTSLGNTTKTPQKPHTNPLKVANPQRHRQMIHGDPITPPPKTLDTWDALRMFHPPGAQEPENLTPCCNSGLFHVLHASNGGTRGKKKEFLTTTSLPHNGQQQHTMKSKANFSLHITHSDPKPS